MTHKIRVTSDGTPQGSKIFIDDVEQIGIVKAELLLDAKELPMVRLTLYVDDVEFDVEGEVDVGE